MKATFFTTLFSLLSVSVFAQDRTTVNAMNSEISDNLDLRAVASIFGDSKDLEDFEYRLNDPKNQISNLDLNNDNQVDYLRVIESTEGRTHIIVVQSVLGRDLFQDVATVEVERDANNRVQVQVVGDVYMYGSNYIYEPVYVHTPVIYTHFWVPNYRPYCSAWYWGYYPTHYYAWSPFPIFRYRSHIGLFINYNHHYNYVNYRRCHVAYNNYYGRRGNGYERQYPNRSFTQRHGGYTNRHELDKTRNIRTVGSTRNDALASSVRGTGGTRANTSTDAPTRGTGGTRANTSSDAPTRGTGGTRANTSSDAPTRGTGGTRANTSSDAPTRGTGGTRATTSSDAPTRGTGGTRANTASDAPTRGTGGTRVNTASDAPTRGNGGTRVNTASDAPTRGSAGPRVNTSSSSSNRGNVGVRSESSSRSSNSGGNSSRGNESSSRGGRR